MIERKGWCDVGTYDGVWGQLGVFQLADADDKVTYVSYAGGRSRFGLRGEIAKMAQMLDAPRYRFEITSAYLSRYREVLMRFQSEHGYLPDHEPQLTLGRIGAWT